MKNNKEMEGSRTEEIKKLIEKDNELVDTWRLFFQPGSIIKHFNIEKRLSALDPNVHRPNREDWIAGVSLEVLKGSFYAVPIITLGIKTYQSYTGN